MPTPRETRHSGLIFLMVALIAIPTFYAGLACSDDILPHLYRSVQLDLNIRHGRPLLQWSQDLMRGYGYPIFAFYAPLAYILIQLAHFLGPDLGTLYQWAFWGVLPLAGWGAYHWARRYYTPTAAFVTGIAYMFAPYLLYNAIQRGALPEALALALFPWAMYTADTLQNKPTTPAIIRTAATFALLILAHNVVALFALPLALLFALLHANSRQAPLRQAWTNLKPTLASITLALTLTAWFWVPIPAELPYTQSRLETPYLADWPTPQNQTLPANKLIAFPAITADPDLLNPPRLRTIGVGQAAFALMGLLLAGWHTRRRKQLIAAGAVVSMCLYATTIHSIWLWDLGLDAIQLPSRLLGPASLLTALLAGQAIHQTQQWSQNKPRALPFLIGTAAAMLTAVSGWPWLYTPYCPVTPQPSQFQLVEISTWSRIIAAAQGELLPKWVQSYPPQDFLLEQYDPTAEFLLINRLELEPNQANTAVHHPIAPAHHQYQLNLAQPTTATYHTFYFPGWQATLNGQPLPLTIQPPHGLIQLQLPAGQHQLDIFFSRTPIRRITLWLSGLAALLTLLTYARTRPQKATSHPRPISLRPLWLTAVLLLILKFGLINPFNTPIRASRLQTTHFYGVDVPTNITFANQFQHLGYNAPTAIAAGQPFPLEQYWTPLANIGIPYQFDVRLADDEGHLWHTDHQRPHDYVFYPGPTNWQQGKYALDAYLINTLPGTPPGTYWLETSVFRQTDAFALTAENAPTAANPAWVRLGQINILPPPENPTLTPENAAVQTIHQHPLTTQPALTLYGSSLITAPPIQPNDKIALTLLWQTSQPLAQTTNITLTLANTAQQPRATHPLTIPHNPTASPTTIRQQTTWRLPRQLESGRYTIWLDGLSLGQIDITAPERQFTRPPTDHTTAATFSFAQLDGYTLAQPTPSQPHQLTLLWHARQLTDTNYRVFIHLRHPDGQIIAQSDSEPAQWSRPTSGWLVDEYILDPHQLTLPTNLPAGNYPLIVGLYNPATMQRLGETHLTDITIP